MCAAFGQPPSTLPTSLVCAGQRRLPRANHVGAEEGVGSSGLQGQRLGGIILGVDR
ncbi:hypothetical protein IE985_20325 [Klebsiella pneumoniae]|nr:hypothetical protein [Klebsiella pneumoniae]